MKEENIVDSISHTEIRNILVKHGLEWRPSKTDLDSSKSKDPEYDLKKEY